MQFTENTQFEDILTLLHRAEYVRNKIWAAHELNEISQPSLYRLAIDEIEKLRAQLVERERGQ